MRALVSSWTGQVFKDSNMTQAGETYAHEIIELFDRADTLSEFNSATYTGISIISLTMWAKYAPESSVMKAKGVEMLQDTWKTVGQLYHAGLKNLAGPWDRSYGFDMQRYFGVMSAHIWTLVGKAASPVIDKVRTHYFEPSHRETSHWLNPKGLCNVPQRRFCNFSVGGDPLGLPQLSRVAIRCGLFQKVPWRAHC